MNLLSTLGDFFFNKFSFCSLLSMILPFLTVKISPGLNLKISLKIVFFPVVYCNSKYSISFSSEILFFMILVFISGVISELNIIPSLKRHAKKIASLTGNNKSTIAKSADIKIELKSHKEACPLDLAPTSSTTNALAFGDALAIALLEAKGFTKNDFASSHPAGKLGKKLITKVSDLMHKGSSVPKVKPDTVLDDALLEITKKNLGITLVTNKKKIVGIFTDGDLRRCINNKVDIQRTKIKEVMTKNFKTISFNSLAVDAAEMMEQNKIFTLVVMNKKEYVGVITMHDLIEARIL